MHWTHEPLHLVESNRTFNSCRSGRAGVVCNQDFEPRLFKDALWNHAVNAFSSIYGLRDVEVDAYAAQRVCIFA
jgi:hypothetical protein